MNQNETDENKSKKGISPLIASVLLIAFTMAIAGIMATWATQFSQQRLSDASEKSDCIGSLTLETATFDNGVVSVRIRNVNGKINLTGLKGSLTYQDVTKNNLFQSKRLKDYNVADPLEPVSSSWFIYNTQDATKPQKVEVVASNCPENVVTAYFK